jgi:hypothetical protein
MTAAQLARFTGRFPHIADPVQNAAYVYGVRVSESFYPPGTADYDQKVRQVLLTAETADYLYRAYTPLDLHYVPGSRPVLERLVQRLVRPTMTEREKALAIVHYCQTGFRQDYPNHLPPNTVVLNASEEEVLKLDGGQCEDRSRLICCLAQIAGLPARCVAVYSHFRPEEQYAMHGGHAILELCIDRQWAFFDSSVLMFYCCHPDGRIANLWELLSDPTLVDRQPDSVLADCQATRERFRWYADEYLNPRSAATITNYYVWDGWRYDWQWVYHQRVENDATYERRKVFRQQLRREILDSIGVTTA